MKELFSLLEKLKKEIDSRKEFDYWKYLDESGKILEKLEKKIEGTIEKNVSVKGKLALGKGSVIKSGSYIEGNVFVGKNCKIGPNAFLRNGTVLADNCHVGMSEVKNSIILGNSNAPHFNYVGDSVIGENVNLGAGTKIANLRHDNQNVWVKINGKKIDSCRKKLGALVGSNTKTGINSSVNCGKIVPNGTKILPNEFFA